MQRKRPVIFSSNTLLPNKNVLKEILINFNQPVVYVKSIVITFIQLISNFFEIFSPGFAEFEEAFWKSS